MSEPYVHERQCREILGKPFIEVHRYLDQYNDPENYPFTAHLHRRFLHHRLGLGAVVIQFGSEAEEAARIHILEDCLGYIPFYSDYDTGMVDEYGRPKNERLMDTHWFEKLKQRIQTR